jgi:hypothetical protein
MRPGGLAVRIMAAAKDGERDPKRLVERALKYTQLVTAA